MLILITGIIAINIVMGICGSIMVKWEKKSLNAYAEGGTVAEEVRQFFNHPGVWNQALT